MDAAVPSTYFRHNIAISEFQATARRRLRGGRLSKSELDIAVEDTA